jgi:hypothetical protein
LAVFGSGNTDAEDFLHTTVRVHVDSMTFISVPSGSAENLLLCLAQLCNSLEYSFDSGLDIGTDLIRHDGGLANVSMLLTSATLVAEKVHLEDSHVLVGSADGRDDALLISCLAQVLRKLYIAVLSLRIIANATV